MPVFFFDIHSGNELSIDDEGMELRDVLAAQEEAARAYSQGKIGGFLHLYIGQEAVAVGLQSAMTVGKDSVITGYRDHGHMLAYGIDPKLIMAELTGRADDLEVARLGLEFMGIDTWFDVGRNGDAIPADLLEAELFGPLGMTSADPRFDAAGTFIGSSFFYCTARDFARFGQLFLDEGAWGDEQVVPASWVAR